MSYQHILTRVEASIPGSGTGVITFNRPKALNALNTPLMIELGQALKAFDADDAIGCIIITGNEKAFAAGADIAEMAELTYADVYGSDYITRDWETIRLIRKPVIAAVAGYALGGGNELAMMCDFIIAADNAQFGQPEIKLGIIPGAGGTQRLPRAIGKSKAMEMILTGRTMSAQEAERCGLVARVVPLASLMDDALITARFICSYGRLAVLSAKESINRAYEAVNDGIMFERRLFHGLFATQDKHEGMDAFLNKRAPKFHGR